jgi:hypothetical protein
MRTLTRFLLLGAAVIAFASALSPLVYGQTPEQVEAAKTAEMINRAGENERRVAAWELRMAEVRRPPERRRDSSLAYTQIRDDYKQIQLVNNDLAKATAAAGSLDFKYVAKSVSDIKSRAARLKENLMLPEDKKTAERPKAEPVAEAGRLKNSLIVLDNLVMAFVNNPIFEQAKAVNIEQAIKARHNLEDIIELSEQIKKSVEKLKSGAQNTQ